MNFILLLCRALGRVGALFLITALCTCAWAGVVDDARTALDQGERARAFLLLQRALAENPDDENAKTLIAELNMPVRPFAEAAGRKAWVGLEAGYDSNITNGITAPAVFVPALNRYYPVPQVISAASGNFLALNSGLQLSTEILSATQGFLAANASLRANFAHAEYLPYSYFIAAGAERRAGTVRWDVSASMSEQWLARYRLLTASAIAVQAAVPTVAALETLVSVAWRRNDYPYFDHDRTQGQRYGIGVGSDVKNSVFAFSGEERSNGTDKSLDRRTSGIEARLARPWRYGSEFRFFGAWAESRYIEPSPLFRLRRRDSSVALAAEIDFPVSGRWHALPRLSLERNNSNVPLMDFSRRQWSLEMRRDF